MNTFTGIPKLSTFFGKKRPNQSGSGAIKIGVARGEAPGHVGVWVDWNVGAQAIEVYRVTVRTEGAGLSYSYTFAPAFEKPFAQSIEFAQPLKQFLVGSNRAKSGKLVFEFFLSQGKTLKAEYMLSEIIPVYRLKGKTPPRHLSFDRPAMLADTADVAKLAHADLHGYSEKVKKEIAERLRREEEERQKKEQERLAAEAKAAEAKRAAAASKTAGGSAGAAPAEKGIKGGRIAIIYGSSTGNTADVGEMIKKELGSVDHYKNVTDLTGADFNVCEIMILGVPTWHIGEMQDDWAVILPDVAKNNYAGKKVAIFGLGDFKGYPDTYVDAMQELWEKFEKTGAKLVGLWPTTGYDFKASKAIKDGKFLGLVIDVENQHNLTESRVKTWCQQIRSELGI